MGAAAGMVIGLALLAFASDWFVVGAARVATMLRVPAVVVGAVVIGFGTSAPEMLVTVLASARGEASLAVGNVVGSNLANLTLVLGTAALIAPIIVSSRTLRREAPLSTAAVCLFGAALLAGLTPVTGVLLLATLAGVLLVVVRTAVQSRRRDDAELRSEVAEYEDGGYADDGYVDAPTGLSREVGRSAIGLGGTLLGAQLVVSSALSVAQDLGLSEGFVGLTIVAVGTSLPELVTAIQGARRAEHDLVVGNVLGSNLFNSLAAGGLIGVVAGSVSVEGRMVWSLALMVAVALFVGLVMVWRRTLRRIEAAVLLVGYAAIVPLLGGD
jgi:cation:H+ antiporter